MPKDNRSPLLGVVALAGCAMRFGAIPPADLTLSDGATLTREAPVRLAIVGAAPSDAVVADVRRWDPDLVLLVGDLVPRSRPRRWREVQARWGELLPRAVPVAGEGEHRGDRRLRGLRAAFPDVGVQALEAGWWHADVVHADVRWRFVLLDARPADWRDQVFWLPKVLSGSDYARLVVVIGAESERVGALEASVRELAPPTALTAWITGGAPSAGIALPEGPFGHVAVRPGPAETRWWRGEISGGELELALRELTPAARESTPIRSSEWTGWGPVGD